MIVVSMLLAPCQKALYASLHATKSSLCMQGVQSLHATKSSLCMQGVQSLHATKSSLCMQGVQSLHASSHKKPHILCI